MWLDSLFTVYAMKLGLNKNIRFEKLSNESRELNSASSSFTQKTFHQLNVQGVLIKYFFLLPHCCIGNINGLLNLK